MIPESIPRKVVQKTNKSIGKNNRFGQTGSRLPLVEAVRLEHDDAAGRGRGLVNRVGGQSPVAQGAVRVSYSRYTALAGAQLDSTTERQHDRMTGCLRATGLAPITLQTDAARGKHDRLFGMFRIQIAQNSPFARVGTKVLVIFL